MTTVRLYLDVDGVVNVFPSQIEEVLLKAKGVGANYFIIVEKHGDLDKLTRMLLDAFTTARVWTDDSLVCELNVRKQYPGMIPELSTAGVVVRVALMVDDTDTLPLEGGA